MFLHKMHHGTTLGYIQEHTILHYTTICAHRTVYTLDLHVMAISAFRAGLSFRGLNPPLYPGHFFPFMTRTATNHSVLDGVIPLHLVHLVH